MNDSLRSPAVQASTFISWCEIEARNADRRMKYHEQKRGWCRQAEIAADRRNNLYGAADAMREFVRIANA